MIMSNSTEPQPGCDPVLPRARMLKRHLAFTHSRFIVPCAGSLRKTKIWRLESSLHNVSFTNQALHRIKLLPQAWGSSWTVATQLCPKTIPQLTQSSSSPWICPIQAAIPNHATWMHGIEGSLIWIGWSPPQEKEILKLTTAAIAKPVFQRCFQGHPAQSNGIRVPCEEAKPRLDLPLLQKLTGLDSQLVWQHQACDEAGQQRSNHRHSHGLASTESRANYKTLGTPGTNNQHWNGTWRSLSFSWTWDRRPKSPCACCSTQNPPTHIS